MVRELQAAAKIGFQLCKDFRNFETCNNRKNHPSRRDPQLFCPRHSSQNRYLSCSSKITQHLGMAGAHLQAARGLQEASVARQAREPKSSGFERRPSLFWKCPHPSLPPSGCKQNFCPLFLRGITDEQTSDSDYVLFQFSDIDQNETGQNLATSSKPVGTSPFSKGWGLDYYAGMQPPSIKQRSPRHTHKPLPNLPIPKP